MKKVLFLVAAFALLATPAFAGFSYDLDLMAVGNANNANVVNNVGVVANTGLNGAVGNSGDVTMRTGDATAITYTHNQVNTNTNVVNDYCGCEEGRSGRHCIDIDKDILLVGNANNANVVNNVGVGANTGLNGAYDNGGTFVAGYYDSYDRHFLAAGYQSDWFGSRGGFVHGHESGHSGGFVSFPMGGDVSITTGDAGVAVDTINVLNTNVNRVNRGIPVVELDPQ